MKKDVLNIEDLQKLAPFFKSRFGTWIGKLLIKWFGVDKINRVHSNSVHLSGAEFTSALLKDPLIDLKYKIHNEETLNQLPHGAFVTVSNHPIGSLDGVILIDIFAYRRPDFKVLVNGVLTHIHALSDNFISVVPDSERQGANLQNVNGIRTAFACLKEGHPIGFFPAGGISSYSKKRKEVRDHRWALSIIRLIRKTQVPVIPVYFGFQNSRFFYWLGTINWRIRTLRIPAEVFNKRGKTADIYIGKPITVEEINKIPDDGELGNFLYQRTYQAKGHTSD